MEPKRNAFTLVELLVVITIIGILSSLITAGVMGAMRSAKQARIKMLMGQVELALEQYKNKYGEYPPDWSDQRAVLRHINKRWPRIDFTFGGQTAYANISTDTNKYQNFRSELQRISGWRPVDHSQTLTNDMGFMGSLAFWLGGVPDNATTASTGWQNRDFVSLIGFSADPSNPFNVGTPGNRPSMEPPILELEMGKNLAAVIMVGGNSANDDVIPAIFAESGPIVYFRASSGNEKTAYAAPIDGYSNLTDPVLSGSGRYPFNQRGKCFLHWDFFPDNSGDGGVMGSRGTNGLGYIFSSTNPMDNIIRFYPGVAVPHKMKGNQNSGINGANPQVVDVNTNWYNSKSYQLVHPGLDGKFGRWTPSDIPYGGAGAGGMGDRAVVIGTGVGVGQFDLDNIVNFGDGATLKSLLP